MSNENNFGSTPMDGTMAAESPNFNDAMNAVANGDKPISAQNESFFNKKGPLGLPMGAIIGIAVLLVIIVFGTVIGVAVKSRNEAAARQAALQSKTGDNQYTMELATLREQLNTLTAKTNDTQRGLLAFQAQVDTRLSNTGTANLERRVVEMDSNIQRIATAQATLAKRMADNRPLADMLKRDNSASIVSIGNGIARVKDEAGMEHSLQKGDKWNGKTVNAIRSDTNQVILSDGSSLL